MNRDPASVAFEADYWKAILDDMASLNTMIEEAADELSKSVVPLIELAVMHGPQGAAGAASEAVNLTMTKIAAMQTPLLDMIRTAQGRVVVLEGELA